ncbi:peroxidase 65-like [Mangifera indica]|uniref:peroxidase 65-like n=1 Tax=Mangifera indica TaxID=29780 RepID=UPI001CFB5165|nr:peroxidase 65-like [Mangifera indica]
MNPQFSESLQGPCPKKKFDPTVVAFNNVTTPIIFDNSYFRNLQKGMGLLATDQMLILNPMTGDYVKKMAENQKVFFDSFVSAMIKLGSIGVQGRMETLDLIAALSTVNNHSSKTNPTVPEAHLFHNINHIMV